jgi:hypothetical protein
MADMDEIQKQKSDARYVSLLPPCAYCKHLTNSGNQHDNEQWTCKAFPNGIPYGIWARHIPHDVDLPGQVPGYHYESNVYNMDDDKQVITFDGKWVSVK